MRDVRPAGETYMHEGIKKVRFTVLFFRKSCCLVERFLHFDLKASEQIQQQSTKSSTIILALTDGKLDVYIHDLTVTEVSYSAAESAQTCVLPVSRRLHS